MKKEELFLTKVKEGHTAIFASAEGGQSVRKKLRDMGLKEGMKFRVLHSHGKSSCIIRVGHTRLVIGHGMAQKIKVKEIGE